MFRLNPKYKIDVYNNAVSNKSETVYFEDNVGCACKDCCGGISQKSSSSWSNRYHPVTSVRKVHYIVWTQTLCFLSLVVFITGENDNFRKKAKCSTGTDGRLGFQGQYRYEKLFLAPSGSQEMLIFVHLSGQSMSRALNLCLSVSDLQALMSLSAFSLQDTAYSIQQTLNWGSLKYLFLSGWTTF